MRLEAGERDSLKDLEAYWYQRLADEGFEDIEDISKRSRPLKDWHSFKFPAPHVRDRQARHSGYQEQAEALLHHEDFLRICESLSRHGCNTLEVSTIQLVWQMHCEMITEREIALKINRSKTAVHWLIERFRSWMRVL